MNPSYLAENKKELFDKAPDAIKTLIKGGEVNAAATTLGQIYKLPIGLYSRLANVISFILIGAIQPKDVVLALVDGFKMENTEAVKLAHDLEKGILEKARQINLGTSGEAIVNLEFRGERTKEDLRKEIIDTTKRDSGLVKPQSTPTPKKASVITPGSRSQLLEQLQILGSIPKDDEIEERLKHIQEQIASIKKVEEDTSLKSNIALKSFMFGEKGKATADATQKMATYSVAPTHYNIDPYREVAED